MIYRTIVWGEDFAGLYPTSPFTKVLFDNKGQSFYNKDMARDGDRVVLRPITEEQKVNKNVNGELGPICNNCGGLGWTMLLTGGNANCTYCDATGVATMTRQQLQKEILECKAMIAEIIQHLIDEKIILKGIKFPVKEGN